jgi:hypothetical protein
MLYINDANEYFTAMAANKKVKIMEETLQFEDKIQLFDISLHKKGPLEDKCYIKHPYFYENIRRGNSLIRINESISFCRRGMKKFYDLEKEFLEAEDQNFSGYKKRVKEGIFTPIQSFLSDGAKITLFKLFKENGEHC